MEGAGEDALVFVDMTVPGYWLAGYARVERVRSLHYPMGWGTLGFAFPAAIGAVAETRSGSGRPVVAVCGDGGFLYAPGELATVVQEDLPLTVVVVDDGGYGMLRYGHAPEEWPQLGTELHSPDFAALAQSFGVDARSVDGVGEDYRRALRDAIASPRPVLIHLRAVMQPPRTTSPRWPLRV
jgi:acetolactate synthase-1/2/3 large subunit